MCSAVSDLIVDADVQKGIARVDETEVVRRVRRAAGARLALDSSPAICRHPGAAQA